MSEDAKNYSQTLNLPKTDFPMRGGLPEKEPQILAKWEEQDVYNKLMEQNKDKKSFVFHDGPPYANGKIHIGHAFNKTLKDIIVRYKNMSGYCAHFIPGWDTHGLPIEKKVEQELKIRKDEVGIPKFREICEEYALSQVEGQKQGFKRLGVIGDYDHSYITLDKDFEVTQIKVFADMYKKGYIYRDLKPVYWCEDCATALAEAEIEYKDSTATSIFVKFKVVGDKGLFKDVSEDVYFVIWTTTPWTMPGNQAVTVNPDFEYSLIKAQNGEKTENYVMATELADGVLKQAGIEEYTTLSTFKGEEFENVTLQHPMLPKLSRVILGSEKDLIVTLDAGTGLVHTAPGHGHEDYLVCKRYKDIEIICPVDDKGYMTEEAGKDLQGLKYNVANSRVIELLTENKALLAKEDIVHPYPHCWRCHKPVIYRATTQWFASVDKFRDDALEAVKTVSWYPVWGEERMLNMIKDRSDWCISRQRVWGVPIPIFYCKDCGKELINDETIAKLCSIFEQRGTTAWYELTPEQLLDGIEFKCECGCTDLIKETDIMDVWFDSGSSHFEVLNNPKYKLSWPADLYLEGNDQYRGWFQSSLLTSVAVKGEAPYKAVVTHGFLTDGQGKKMSKSLGNGIDPNEVFDEFGADILRLWAISSDYHVDVKVSKDIIKGVAEVYKKIRNTARFMLGNLYDFNPDTEYVDYASRDEIDKYIMYKVNELVKECRQGYDEYDFHVVFNAIHKFCTADLSSKYLDVVKDRLYTEKATSTLRKSTQSTMYDVLTSVTKLLSPVLCYTAEEIWSYINLKAEDKTESVILSQMPDYNSLYEDSTLAAKFDELYEIRDKVLVDIEKARAEKIVGHPLDANVIIYVGEKDKAKYDNIKDMLEMILIVSQVEVVIGEHKVVVEKAKGAKCERCWKYNEHVGEDSEHGTICPRCVNAIK